LFELPHPEALADCDEQFGVFGIEPARILELIREPPTLAPIQVEDIELVCRLAISTGS
jgi:hypothetical protein